MKNPVAGFTGPIGPESNGSENQILSTQELNSWLEQVAAQEGVTKYSIEEIDENTFGTVKERVEIASKENKEFDTVLLAWYGPQDNATAMIFSSLLANSSEDIKASFTPIFEDISQSLANGKPVLLLREITNST